MNCYFYTSFIICFNVTAQKNKIQGDGKLYNPGFSAHGTVLIEIYIYGSFINFYIPRQRRVPQLVTNII